jgi:Zn-dependent protease
MDIISKAEEKEGRRLLEERREDGREEHRRNHTNHRREDSLARTLVYVFDSLRLPAVSDFVKFLKALKILGPLAMIISATVMAVTYTFTMKVSIAFGIVLALVVHEFGHYLAIGYCGYTPRWWLHIPFMGAFMRAPDFTSRHDEAFVAFGGPFVGGVFSLLLFAFWMFVPLSREWSTVLYLLTLASTVLNLFNLIPLSPLDGGRITQAIHPIFRWIGFALLCVVSYFYREASFAVVWILVIGEVRVKPINRFRIALCLLAAMSMFMLLGYHNGNLWEEGIYLALGAYLTKMHHSSIKATPIVEHDWRKVALSRRTQIVWVINYFSLLIALSLLACVLIRLAPRITA